MKTLPASEQDSDKYAMCGSLPWPDYCICLYVDSYVDYAVVDDDIALIITFWHCPELRQQHLKENTFTRFTFISSNFSITIDSR